ncbi:cytotoxic necrotizing factor Rho-activating domain-containing protein [Erwinia mallotivora]|uniref:Toxin TccC3 n=1 Tax=Erwinia mallotivora TaxID=69222 RepID=A0A014NAG0_9GAMM|nr:cytotoxic necrotizing factor Rho-activating domain-containing protein [Erwinia mallotivora]EXU76398.1 toxin TccC3 [Erwinia mallotivora]
MNRSLFHKTPTVKVTDNRGLTVRDIIYHRHPDSPEFTDERLTYHRYDPRGFLTESTDPRLHQAGLVNLHRLNDLTGDALLTQSADAGTTIFFKDASERPCIRIDNICINDDGTTDPDQKVTHTYQYENADLPGRPLSVTEQVNGEAARITKRFFYAGNQRADRDNNLAGQCIYHCDPAGILMTDGVALTGVPLSVTRLLLDDASDADVVANWQGDISACLNCVEATGHTSLSIADATGSVFNTTDAAGNQQRMQFDVAGLLSSCWLTVKGGMEQVIVTSLTWSAAGQKLREEYGNGVVNQYRYELETQRVIGITTFRPAGHPAGAKMLQDLHYGYDPAGNIISIRNDAEKIRFWRNQKVVPGNTYVYDSIYQMVRATGREMANACQQDVSKLAVNVPLITDNVSYTSYIRSYLYDRAGNLLQIRHGAPATGNNYTTKITVSDRSNRAVLSSLVARAEEVDALFTNRGCQTELVSGQHLSWTSRGDLLRVTTVARKGSADDTESYRYDSGSQRVLKISRQQTQNSVQTRQVLYLPGLERRKTFIGSVETENLQVINARVAQVQALCWENGRPHGINNDQLRYSCSDLNGSITLELDGEGNLIDYEEYYPFGGTAVRTARSAVEVDYKTVRYSGKERDATGLYYYGYRYYQPWAGRWLSADPAGTVDGLNLYRMCRNNPLSYKDQHGLVGRSLTSLFVSDDQQLKKGSITPLRSRGLLVGSDTVETSLQFDIHRYDSDKHLSEPLPYTSEILNEESILHKTVMVFDGQHMTSSESGAGKIGSHWDSNKLSKDIQGIQVANGMSGSVGIRIALDSIHDGNPLIVTSGALSGCSMIYTVDDDHFYALHTGQKPGDNKWKTGLHGVASAQHTLQALSGKTLDTSGNHNNDLIDTLGLFDNSALTFFGKEGTRTDRVKSNVTTFDYNLAQAPKFSIRAGYSYALLAKKQGKTIVKVLSEDVSVNSMNKKINVLGSMKFNLR